MRIPLLSKTLMKTETFQNGFKSGVYWKRSVSSVDGWKRWRGKRDLLSLPLAFSGVLVWKIGLNASKVRVFEWKRIRVDRGTQNWSASVGENILLCFRRDGSGSSWEATNTEYLLLLFAVVNLDGKVQTARSVKCTPDAFMAHAASHGNVIALTAGVEFFAI